MDLLGPWETRRVEFSGLWSVASSPGLSVLPLCQLDWYPQGTEWCPPSQGLAQEQVFDFLFKQDIKRKVTQSIN